MKTISKLVFILLFVVSGSIYAASWEDLNAESANALFSDITIVHKKFKQYAAPDGTQKGTWGGTTHTGKYFINDEGHYCSTWDEEGKTDVGCWSLSKKKNKLKMIPASGRADKEYTVKIMEGYALAGALAMSTEEVIKLISGMTVHGTNTRGKKYRMYFAENGSLTAGNKSTGKWEVKDGSVCNTWDECGFAGCDAVFKNKGKIIYKTPSVKTNVGSKS
jgi:hypothetical protein